MPTSSAEPSTPPCTLKPTPQTLPCSLQVILVYDKVFWDKGSSWIQRVATSNATSSLRFTVIFNVAKYIPELPLLVAFNAADAAWKAEKDSDKELGAEVSETAHCTSQMHGKKYLF